MNDDLIDATRFLRVKLTKANGGRTVFLQVQRTADLSKVITGSVVNRDGQPVEKIKGDTVTREVMALTAEDCEKVEEYRQSRKYGQLVKLED